MKLALESLDQPRLQNPIETAMIVGNDLGLATDHIIAKYGSLILAMAHIRKRWGKGYYKLTVTNDNGTLMEAQVFHTDFAVTLDDDCQCPTDTLMQRGCICGSPIT